MFSYFVKRYGFLQNDLIYRTLAIHITAVKDVEWIPGLSRDFDSKFPRGALALMATAVCTFHLLYPFKNSLCQIQRAVKFWGTNKVINDDASTQGIGAIQFVPQPTPRGKPSTRYAAFSHSHYNLTTQSMLKLIEKLLPDEKIDTTSIFT